MFSCQYRPVLIMISWLHFLVLNGFQHLLNVFYHFPLFLDFNQVFKRKRKLLKDIVKASPVLALVKL